MTTPYDVREGTANQRQAVATCLAGLDLVSHSVREQIITSWVSAWTSSPHAALEDMPYSTLAPRLTLMQHVNEVTRTGIELARRAIAEWQDPIDWDVMVSILTLHDIDKPLLFVREDGKVVYTPLAKELPHGVTGAMLLKDLGFPHIVISTVATHASNAPFHGCNVEAYILHYADFFATDRACMREGTTPFYQRHWR
jgi:putative nucleotidyltransferase with HDIG domain